MKSINDKNTEFAACIRIDFFCLRLKNIIISSCLWQNTQMKDIGNTLQLHRLTCIYESNIKIYKSRFKTKSLKASLNMNNIIKNKYKSWMNAFLNQINIKHLFLVETILTLLLLWNVSIISKKLQIKHWLDCQFKD